MAEVRSHVHPHLFNCLFFFFIDVRRYMPIQTLTELIMQKYLSDIADFNVNNVDHRDQFHKDFNLDLARTSIILWARVPVD